MDGSFVIIADISFELSDSPFTEALKFTTKPSTVIEIKSRIEEECSIPACVQTISFDGTQLTDQCTTESLYLRGGDTIQVYCLNKGKVEEVKSVVKWLGECVEFLKSVPLKNMESIAILRRSKCCSTLRRSLFRRSDPSLLVNCRHFDFLGGVELLVKFHGLLVKQRQNNLHSSDEGRSEYMEFVCCDSITNYCVHNKMSKRMAESGGLDNCIGTFLIKQANDARLLRHQACVRVALAAIYNIVDSAKLHDKYLELVQNESVIAQILSIAESPVYSSPTFLKSISLLVCVSRSQGSETIVLKPDMIHRIIDIYKYFKERKQDSGREDSKLVALYYVGILFAQLICKSYCILATFPITLLEEMEKVLKQASEVDSLKVQQYEQKDGIVWGTFAHCMNCLYEHHSLSASSSLSHSSQLLLNTLHDHATNVLLHHLLISLGRKDHFQVVVEEELYDYVVMLPWILPHIFQERAQCICKELNKFQPIQPVSLAILAKGMLAKSCFGLQRVINTELIAHLFN